MKKRNPKANIFQYIHETWIKATSINHTIFLPPASGFHRAEVFMPMKSR